MSKKRAVTQNLGINREGDMHRKPSFGKIGNGKTGSSPKVLSNEKPPSGRREPKEQHSSLHRGRGKRIKLFISGTRVHNSTKTRKKSLSPLDLKSRGKITHDIVMVSREDGSWVKGGEKGSRSSNPQGGMFQISKKQKRR